MAVDAKDSNGFWLTSFAFFISFLTHSLLSILVSQTVSKQRLSHLMEENEKLEKQMKQRKTLINDQLTKITKQVRGHLHPLLSLSGFVVIVLLLLVLLLFLLLSALFQLGNELGREKNW